MMTMCVYVNTPHSVNSLLRIVNYIKYGILLVNNEINKLYYNHLIEYNIEVCFLGGLLLIRLDQ